MTGAIIDGLAAIGVFSFLAFAFLPEWEETLQASWDDASMCQNFLDYKAAWMHHAVRDEAHQTIMTITTN